jgi:hypothetical protein
MTLYNHLSTVIQHEPVLEQDRAMMGLLASLGMASVAAARPFRPDEVV